MGGMLASLSLSIGRGGKKNHNRAESRSPSPNYMLRPDDEEALSASDGTCTLIKGLTSDAGWGCMLRTGQSLLANAILVAHLGREWRRPITSLTDPSSSVLPDPVYARLMSWFVDCSSPLAPFSVHRFAAKGKELGKEIGEWFGPSTAAGAIKALTNEFHPAGLGVASDIDGTVYRSDVFQASILPGTTPSKLKSDPNKSVRWRRPVLVLVNVRLGLDRVNPSYYETIKATFTFPQSVGIAGGRPSQSYYFCGFQSDSLFYIDPHHPRPSIGLEEPPGELSKAAKSMALSDVNDQPRSIRKVRHDADWEQVSIVGSDCSLVSESIGSGSSFSKPISSSSGTGAGSGAQEGASSMGGNRIKERLDEFYSKAYVDQALRTYHPEKVRRMSISAMDPSMLVGFLVRNEEDWEDLTHRIRSYKPPLFHIADVTPSWMKPSTKEVHGSNQSQRPSDDSDLGIDSWSEQEDDWGEGAETDTQDQEKVTDESSDSMGSCHRNLERFDDTDEHCLEKGIGMGMEDEDEEWDEVEHGHSRIEQDDDHEEMDNEDGNGNGNRVLDGIGGAGGNIGNRSDTLRANRLQESIVQAFSSSSTSSTTTTSSQPNHHINQLNQTRLPTRMSSLSNLRSSTYNRSRGSEDLDNGLIDPERKQTTQQPKKSSKHHSSKSLSIPFNVFPSNSHSNLDSLPLHLKYPAGPGGGVGVDQDQEAQSRSRNVSAATVRENSGNGNRNDEDGEVDGGQGLEPGGRLSRAVLA